MSIFGLLALSSNDIVEIDMRVADEVSSNCSYFALCALGLIKHLLNAHGRAHTVLDQEMSFPLTGSTS